LGYQLIKKENQGKNRGGERGNTNTWVEENPSKRKPSKHSPNYTMNVPQHLPTLRGEKKGESCPLWERVGGHTVGLVRRGWRDKSSTQRDKKSRKGSEGPPNWEGRKSEEKLVAFRGGKARNRREGGKVREKNRDQGCKRRHKGVVDSEVSLRRGEGAGRRNDGNRKEQNEEGLGERK